MLAPSDHWDWKASGLQKEVFPGKGERSFWLENLHFCLSLQVTVVIKNPLPSIIDLPSGNTGKSGAEGRRSLEVGGVAR